jgi:opacity protein-like surface antigen
MRRLGQSVLALGAALAALSGANAANAAEGWYARGAAGWGAEGGADISSDGPLGGDADLDESTTVAVALGTARGEHWRFEAELSRRDSELAAAPLLDPGGEVQATALMANVFYDFGTGPIRPYAGLGLGVAIVELEATFTPPLQTTAVADDGTAFAYQVMAGVAIEVSPNVTLDFGYQYFSTPGVETEGVQTPALVLPVDVDYSQHALMAGLRWNF